MSESRLKDHPPSLGSAAPRVAAIVINYNGRDITLQAIASLREMTYANFDIIHVDNGSSDGSSEAVAEAFPEVRTVRAEDNIMPAGGLNLGMRTALDGDYQYLLFLNNDIEVDPQMLTELVRVAESSPDIGCVGPKAYYHDDPKRIWSAGGILRFCPAATRERGMGKPDRGQYDEDAEVPYINGCAALIKREALQKVGYFDPLFKGACEDADLCIRLKRAGYSCVYAHKAKLWHMVSSTLGSYTPKRAKASGRSTALLVRRYGSFFQRKAFRLCMLAALRAAFVREWIMREVQKRKWLARQLGRLEALERLLARPGMPEAADAKAEGAWGGLSEPLPAPPSIDAPPERTR